MREGDELSIKDEMEQELRGTTIKGTLQHFLDNCDDYADVIVIARTHDDLTYTGFSASSYGQVFGMFEYGKQAVWSSQQEDYSDESWP